MNSRHTRSTSHQDSLKHTRRDSVLGHDRLYKIWVATVYSWQTSYERAGATRCTVLTGVETGHEGSVLNITRSQHQWLEGPCLTPRPLDSDTWHPVCLEHQVWAADLLKCLSCSSSNTPFRTITSPRNPEALPPFLLIFNTLRSPQTVVPEAATKHTKKYSCVLLIIVSANLWTKCFFRRRHSKGCRDALKEEVYKHRHSPTTLSPSSACETSERPFEQPPAQQAGPKARLLQTQLAKDGCYLCTHCIGNKRLLSRSFSIVSLAKTFTMTVLWEQNKCLDVGSIQSFCLYRGVLAAASTYISFNQGSTPRWEI